MLVWYLHGGILYIEWLAFPLVDIFKNVGMEDKGGCDPWEECGIKQAHENVYMWFVGSHVSTILLSSSHNM